MIKDNSCNQIRILTRIIALACLSSIILSYKIWLSERNFPLSPVFDFLPTIIYPLDWILLSSTILCLLFIILFRNPQKAIIVFLFLSAVLGLFDINRWQPWFYQYVLMFFVLSFFNYSCDDTKQSQSISVILKLMIASIYFWSGLQKLNPFFISDTFPWLMEPFQIENISSLNYLSKSFPIIESLSGIMLLINKTKKIGLILITGMHLFILFVIGPLGHNYNPVVWPWNIAMICFCFILFYNQNKISLKEFKIAILYHSIKITFVLFCLFPQLNFFNLWDSYLSNNLYSGNTSSGVVIFSDSVKNNLPNYIKQYAIADSNSNFINIKYWCMQETGVPAYPEKRNFERIVNQVSNYAKNKDEIYLEFTSKLSIQDLTK